VTVRPYYEQDGITIYHGDCRDVLPGLAADSADLVLTDPPYGVNKAAWDDVFPTWWFDDAARVAPVLGIMPGIANIPLVPFEIGRCRYRWTLVAHLTNGQTRSSVGFGNYIPCMVYAAEGTSVFKQDGDVGRIVVGGDPKPNHPSPKPYQAMRWFVSRLPGDVILDPFMGSGTTLRAAKDLGRRAIGIEIEERYCEEAARRLAQSVLPLAV
jgi:site-specific DNA-methyltransferase (adenine-specific)